jgi:hypothetical protein
MYSIRSNNFKEIINKDRYLFIPTILDKNIIIINCFYKGTISFMIKQQFIQNLIIKKKDFCKTINLTSKFNLKFDVEKDEIIEFYIDINNMKTKIEFLKINYLTNFQNEIVKKDTNVKFILVITKLIESIAIFMSKIINKNGYECKIIYELQVSDCINSTENDIYIIIFNNSNHGLLPKKFIVYQLEQLTSKYFNKNKINELEKSNKIWEYCLYNYNNYSQIDKEKILFQPLPFIRNQSSIENYDLEYDIFFYGTINKRRFLIMNYLSSKYKVKIGFGCIGEEKHNYIKKSKIILNLHYYDNASLETCRLNEIFQYKKIIISEKPADYDIDGYNLYKNLVFFIDEINLDLSNIKILEDTIDELLDENRYKQEIERIDGFKEELENICINHLDKNIADII